MAYIYKITNKINGKFYIGKTKRNGIDRRWQEHQRTALNESYSHPLYDGIRHYGLDNFSIEILEVCNIDELDEREKFWIAELRPIYNLTPGGEGGDTFTNKPEYMKRITRRKLSEASKRNWNDETYRTIQSAQMKKRWSDETYREKIIRKAKENAQNPTYLKRVSEGVKKAIESRKQIWSDCKKGSKNGRWIGRIQMNYPNGNLYRIYESAVDCKNDTGIIAHNIRTKALSGEPMLRGKFRGYTFRLLTTNKVV